MITILNLERRSHSSFPPILTFEFQIFNVLNQNIDKNLPNYSSKFYNTIDDSHVSEFHNKIDDSLPTNLQWNARHNITEFINI